VVEVDEVHAIAPARAPVPRPRVITEGVEKVRKEARRECVESEK